MELYNVIKGFTIFVVTTARTMEGWVQMVLSSPLASSQVPASQTLSRGIWGLEVLAEVGARPRFPVVVTSGAIDRTLLDTPPEGNAIVHDI
jgi:hypothetical protein